LYAGGGGGGNYNQSTIALGVAGGGDGANNATFTGLTGFANTGGGGGGGSVTGSVRGNGGAGGSGIVVIRYPAYLAPAPTVVGANTYISGPYRVYVWVSSGSITF
jgi:hypothetical protein